MTPNNLSPRELFGFERDPFVPDPSRIWLDEQRCEAAEQLNALIERGGFAVLTAPAGCGKTILLGHLCEKLSPTTHRVVYLACPECQPPDMLRLVCAGLDLEPTLGRSRMTKRITDRVAEMKGVTPVLVVDEAQSLPHTTLEALRVICSHGLDGRHRFAVIMAGTDEFLSHLKLRVSEPLRQRVTVYAELTPLKRADTADYLRHRFETAGVARDLIAEAARNLVFDTTNGVPRRIDKLVDEALRNAAREGAQGIVLDHVERAARIVFGRRMETRT
jgi:type II secretory pathway predicted ATPase ExeA